MDSDCAISKPKDAGKLSSLLNYQSLQGHGSNVIALDYVIQLPQSTLYAVATQLTAT